MSTIGEKIENLFDKLNAADRAKHVNLDERQAHRRVRAGSLAVAATVTALFLASTPRAAQTAEAVWDGIFDHDKITHTQPGAAEPLGQIAVSQQVEQASSDLQSPTTPVEQ